MKIIEFGRYWKETGLENVPIEWIVLNETDEDLFVVSKQVVVSEMFDETTANWKDCSIRKWLNNEFLRKAFNEYESPSILEKKIVTSNDMEYVFGGFSYFKKYVETLDKVFLLSVDEVEQYFKTQESRVVERSQYAIDTLEDDRKYVDCWWLRNEAYFDWAPLLIQGDGTYYGLAGAHNLEGIRPAMYIKRNYSELFQCEGQLTLDEILR